MDSPMVPGVAICHLRVVPVPDPVLRCPESQSSDAAEGTTS